MEAAAGNIAELRLPSATLFGDRARRLRGLAAGHSLSEYLRFAAALAECQQRALDRHPDIPLPDAGLLAGSRADEQPMLAPAAWPRHAHWREVARMLAEAMRAQAPADRQAPFASLLAAGAEALEAQAGHLLAHEFASLDLATAPLIAAALQVQWTYLARRLQPQSPALHEQPALCPICGSHPVASIIRLHGSDSGLRYLHCALCGSEWHMVRSKCSQCTTTKAMMYYSIAGGDECVRAEACPACRTYLKVIRQDREPQADPVADDLATLALDLLMGEKDFAKSGMNFLLIHGPGD
jgi:FdhE protein